MLKITSNTKIYLALQTGEVSFTKKVISNPNIKIYFNHKADNSANEILMIMIKC